MRVFVTGSTGLLGINTIEALLRRGHSVMALARNQEKARQVLPSGQDVQVVVGDIERPEEWLPRLEEADALIHTAAYFREYFGRGEHESKLQLLNVELPVRLTLEADRKGLKRTIMVSSSGVIEARPDGKPADENDPAGGAIPDNRYFHSKVLMEAELQKILPSLHHQLVLIRPGWMFGPNDYAPTSAGQLVRDLLQKGAIQLTDGSPVATADARDVATGIVAALEHPTPALIYNLAGNPISALEALREVARQAGKGSVQQIPMPLALALSHLLELPCQLLNRPNPIPRIGLKTISKGIPTSSERAKEELGVRFRPFAETAADTVAFFRKIAPR